MSKTPPLAVDFAMQDLQYLCKMAKYALEHPPDIDLEYLDRVERNRQLSPCPKYQKDVDKAINLFLTNSSGPTAAGDDITSSPELITRCAGPSDGKQKPPAKRTCRRNP